MLFKILFFTGVKYVPKLIFKYVVENYDYTVWKTFAPYVVQCSPFHVNILWIWKNNWTNNVQEQILSLSLSLFLKIALNIKTLKCAATFPRKTFSSGTPLTFMKVHTNRQKYSKLGKIYRYDIITDYICVYSLLSKTGSNSALR